MVESAKDRLECLIDRDGWESLAIATKHVFGGHILQSRVRRDTHAVHTAIFEHLIQVHKHLRQSGRHAVNQR